MTPKQYHELQRQADVVLTKVNVSDLEPGYSIYGNKGNVWSDTAHIYKSGTGNLCGTPALASNWARMEDIQTIGCPGCLAKYKTEFA